MCNLVGNIINYKLSQPPHATTYSMFDFTTALTEVLKAIPGGGGGTVVTGEAAARDLVNYANTLDIEELMTGSKVGDLVCFVDQDGRQRPLLGEWESIQKWYDVLSKPRAARGRGA